MSDPTYTDNNGFKYEIKRLARVGYAPETWQDVDISSGGSVANQRPTDYYNVIITKPGTGGILQAFTPPTVAFYVYLKDGAVEDSDIITGDNTAEDYSETPEIEDTHYFTKINSEATLPTSKTDDSLVIYYTGTTVRTEIVSGDLTDETQITSIRVRIPIWQQRAYDTTNKTWTNFISSLTSTSVTHYLHIVSSITVRLHINFNSLGQGLFTLTNATIGGTTITNPSEKFIGSTSAAAYDVAATKQVVFTFSGPAYAVANLVGGSTIHDTFKAYYYDKSSIDDMDPLSSSPSFSTTYTEFENEASAVIAVGTPSGDTNTFTVTFTPNVTALPFQRTNVYGYMNVYFGDIRNFTLDVHPTVASP